MSPLFLPLATDFLQQPGKKTGASAKLSTAARMRGKAKGNVSLCNIWSSSRESSRFSREQVVHVVQGSRVAELAEVDHGPPCFKANPASRDKMLGSALPALGAAAPAALRGPFLQLMQKNIHLQGLLNKILLAMKRNSSQ